MNTQLTEVEAAAPDTASTTERKTAVVIKFPPVGWCVRPGIWRAHYLFWRRGRVYSACGSVQRVEEYVPQRLRPLQANKERCSACEQALRASNGTTQFSVVELRRAI